MRSRLIERASAKAVESGKVWLVVSVDAGEYRRFKVVPDEYADSDEFFAFDGAIEALCYPEGTVSR
jgi:hypothetical protein